MQKLNSIILVDDNHTTNFLNSKIIEKWSNEVLVHVYNDPSRALNELTGNYNDCLVFVDLNMPIMDGWMLIEQLGQTDFVSRNVVVVLTSSVDARDLARANENENISEFVSKPLTSDVLTKLSRKYFQT